MNIGRQTKKTLQQRPTYRIAPNYTTRPYPKGPLELGTLVREIKYYYPINDEGENGRVAIPEGQRYTDVKEGIVVSLKTSHSGETGILAKVLDRSIIGEASLKGKRSDDDVYKIQKLETVYFYPQRSYINKCLQLAAVDEEFGATMFEEPLYLVTGLKIAWGATISKEHERSYEHNAGVGVVAPGGPVNAGIEAKAGVAGESAISMSFSEPANFVLALQVQKIYHKKKQWWNGKKVLTSEIVNKHAMLVDDDTPERVEDSEGVANFTLADLGDEELDGLEAWVEHDSEGEQVQWLLPSGGSSYAST